MRETLATEPFTSPCVRMTGPILECCVVIFSGGAAEAVDLI
jgi:hypothetical protein